MRGFVLSLVVGTLLLNTSGSVSAIPVKRQQSCSSVPDYVLRHAPIFNFHKDERFFPASPADFLPHVVPLNAARQPIPGPLPLSLANLDQYPSDTFLTSIQDPETEPGFLRKSENKPVGLKSQSSSTVIVVDKGNNVLDAFWFVFYPYNEGPKVLSRHFGNHVGDYEHIMVRFQNGVPSQVWFSAHSEGSAYEYSATKKKTVNGQPRMVAYVAKGSHANYPNNGAPGLLAGFQPYIPVALGLVHDLTSSQASGSLWDPTLGTIESFCFSPASGAFAPTPESPVKDLAHLTFQGKWGDQRYPSNDPRQYDVLGKVFHYESGPTGPASKNLGRPTVCIKDGCEIKNENKGAA
ncbi:hypothetical protein HDU85_006716 [Gaertneriomyces sp. JEL0708]|nr:hypothetical protein HDU85_006716 [Gaertneriomyces sp. JEL0708]